MGFFSDLIEVATPGSSNSISGNLLGVPQREAAERSAELQAQASEAALAYQKEKDALARSDLMPYTQAGTNTLPLYASLLDPSNQENYLLNNPLFKAALERSETSVKNRFGPTGMRGDLSSALTTNYLAQGNQFIDTALDRFNPLLQLGQASAAGQAANGLNSASAANDLLTDGAAAQAAGLIGAANAQSQGVSNVAGLAGTLFGAFMCDRRVKRDVTPLYMDADGIVVHSFRYPASDALYVGKMAQDILDIDPAHVFDHGILMVSEKYQPMRVH